MPLPVSFRHVMLGAANSNLTGAPWFVGDFGFLTVSVQSSAATASRLTIVGTNADGFQSALGAPSHASIQNEWSIVTVLTAPGIYGFSVLGNRWLNAFRNTHDAVTSPVTVTFAGRW